MSIHQKPASTGHAAVHAAPSEPAGKTDRTDLRPRTLEERLAPATFTMNAVIAAMERLPGKSQNRAARRQSVEDFVDATEATGDETLDLATLDALLNILDHRAGFSSGRARRIRSGVKAALAASRLAPIVTPIHMDLNSRWNAFRTAVVETGAEPAHLTRFCRWCQLRDIVPAEIGNELVETFFADFAAVKTAGIARWATSRIVDALSASGLDLDLEPVQSDGRHKIDWSRIPVSLRHDIDAFAAASQRPPVPIRTRGYNDRAKALQANTAGVLALHLSVAASAFVSAGGTFPPAPTLSSLATEPSLASVINGLQLRDAALTTDYERDIVQSVVAAARYHCNMTKLQVAALKKAVETLGKPKPSSLDELKALLDDDVRRDFVDAPNKIRFEAAARPRSDHALNDCQAAIAVEISLQAPHKPRHFLALRFGITVHLSDDPSENVLIALPGANTRTDWLILDDRASRAVRDYHMLLKSLGAPLDHLFIAYDPDTATYKPIDGTRLTRQITSALFRAIGLRLTTRDLYLVHGLCRLLDEPGDVRRVQQVYGYKDIAYMIARFKPVLGLDRSKMLASHIRKNG